MADLDAVHMSNRFLRKMYTAKVPLVILSKFELEQTCPNQRHILFVFLSHE